MGKLPGDQQRKFSEHFLGSREKICELLHRGGAWEEATAKERGILEKSFFEITEREQIDASWRAEGLQVLMWALGMLEKLPAYDIAMPKEVLNGILSSDVAQFVAESQLRERSEIERARRVAEFWHWRSRTRQLIERGDKLPEDPKMKASGFRTFDDIVRTSAERGTADRLFVAIDQDFPANGKAYRDLTAEEWARVRSITMERHFALNWLCGHAPANRWEETPTDT